ncbi:uncharacterized protein [Dysidea avara]|uniref:uncharacterized protein isoform X2 n=1 Tax=Dysidea avara TaxID=196820 RepID=UPI0033285191
MSEVDSSQMDNVGRHGHCLMIMKHHEMSYLLRMLLVSLLLQTTSSAVYYVIPDDHYTSNNNTYTLQHYLNNTNKFFTSHTQLHFLPGKYFLNTDLIIQHVSDLSLIGNRTNEVINSVIKCTSQSPAGIVVVGSSNIVIANIMMNECGSDNAIYPIKRKNHFTTLLVYNSKYFTLAYFNPTSSGDMYAYGMIFINVIGNLTHSSMHFIVIQYDNSTTNPKSVLHVKYCDFHRDDLVYGMTSIVYPALEIQQINTSSNIALMITHCIFISRVAMINICINCSGKSVITVSNCNFSDGYSEYFSDDDYYSMYDSFDYEYYIFGKYNNRHFNDRIHDHTFDFQCGTLYTDSQLILNYYENCKHSDAPNKVQFADCVFRTSYAALQTIDFHIFVNTYEKTNGDTLLIFIGNSVFYNNTGEAVIWACSYNSKFKTHHDSLLIKNTTIQMFKPNPTVEEGSVSTIRVIGIKVYLEDLIISNPPFTFHYYPNVIIDAAVNSYVTFSKYNEISYNSGSCAVRAIKIHLTENTILNLTNNAFFSVFNKSDHKINRIEDCFIQYVSNRGNLDKHFENQNTLNYSIVLINNNILLHTINMNLKHCMWDMNSAFFLSRPLSVNQKYIHYDNFNLIEKYRNRSICLCRTVHKCDHEVLGPFFPGQLVQFSFELSELSEGSILVDRKDHSEIACKNERQLHEISNSFQLDKNICKNVIYVISHENGKWCELCLLVDPLYHNSEEWVEMYTILLKPCPKAFSLHPQGYCQCDPILSSHIPSLTTCDIDHQTILCPANTWISAHTINNSHSYHVSLHCPFDYCLPHSSQLNLSTPDSQCQFNRTGVLCGQCQHGLSTVFVHLSVNIVPISIC